jgi:hypothetical protein
LGQMDRLADDGWSDARECRPRDRVGSRRAYPQISAHIYIYIHQACVRAYARREMFRNADKLARALAKMPAAASTSVNPNSGRIRAPEFSKRVVAELRKAAIASGHEWPWDRAPGVQKTVERPGKGHKHEREKPAREAKIAEALKKQPELIAAYKARLKSKAKGADKVWDDFSLTKKEMTLKIRMQDVTGR